MERQAIENLILLSKLPNYIKLNKLYIALLLFSDMKIPIKLLLKRKLLESVSLGIEIRPYLNLLHALSEGRVDPNI